MTYEQRLECAKRMEDFSHTDPQGVRMTLKFSTLRSVTPQEMERRKRDRENLYREMFKKYGLQPCG